MAIPWQSRNSSCRLLNRLPIVLKALLIYLASLIHFKKAANSLSPTYLLMAKQEIVSQGAYTKLMSIHAITDPPLFIGTAVFLAFWLNTCHLWTTQSVGESARLQIMVESIAWILSGRPGVLYVLPVFACFCLGHL